MLADLVGAGPFAADGPWAHAEVVGVGACEVTIFGQAAAGVAAEEVNDFVLWRRDVSQYLVTVLSEVKGLTWHMLIKLEKFL